jgi:hypothetical protein
VPHLDGNMTWNTTRIALLVPASLYLSGCSDGVGTCDTTTHGRDTVLVGSVVQYGGQAIINSACANGTCHSSAAEGEARHGAPAFLDFDLVPVDPSEAAGEDQNKRGDAIVQLTDRQLVNLRSRQLLLVRERDAVWQQVRDGLMPPSGIYEAYRQLKTIFDSDESEPCTRAKRFTTTSDGDAQEVLRNWLACGAPIVEVNSPLVEKNAVAGRAGFQYPICGGDGDVPDDGGEPIVISLQELLDTGPLSFCVSCHPSSSKPDLKTLAAATTMVNSEAEVCNGKPYVTRGDPDRSFLYEVLSDEKPGCDVRRMPIGSKLTAAELKLVRDWIGAGAPLKDANIEPSAPADDTDAGADSKNDGDSGSRPQPDAGVRDAGRSDAGGGDAGRRDAGR